MFDLAATNNPIIVIVAFLLVLIPAVIVHELGHFIAAKAVGITILEFAIGMPPRLVKLFTWRGTEVTLNALPLGGFVRPLGEDMVRQMGEGAISADRQEALDRGIEHPVSVNEARPASRILFMAGGAIANFIFAFLIFMVVGLTGLPTLIGSRAEVVRLDPASPLTAGGLQAGDQIEAVNGANAATPAELIALLAAAAGESAQVQVRREGVSDPLTLTVDVPSSFDQIAEEHPMIRGIADASPAALAGVMAGDLVLAVNETPITTYQELQEITRANLGQEVTLELWRDGNRVSTSLVPRENPPEGQGSMGIEITTGGLVAALGLAYAQGQPVQQLVPLSFGDAVRYSAERMAGVIQQVASVPGQLISALTSNSAPNENLRITSPLGISQVGGVLLQESIQQRQPTIILEYMGLISLALGLTNLLPIPALDGGRILFVLVEIVRGKPISPEREGMVHLVGLMLLLSLMVVVVLNDIANPLTDMLR